MSTLTVELDERSYPIQIEAGLLSQPGFFVPYIKGQRAIIVTNETVARQSSTDPMDRKSARLLSETAIDISET